MASTRGPASERQQVDIDDTADLVRAAAAGDPAAWTSLVRRFSGLVWSVARGYRLGSADAEDVCQTTWLRLAESIHRIEHPERVAAWLIVTARREALRTIQVAARATPVADFDGPGAGLRDDDTPESVTLRREQATIDRNRARDLWGALHRLSPRCQALLRLLMTNPPPRYVDVAHGLDMPIGSIGPTRRRCLGHLGRLANRRGITQDVEPS